MTRRAPEVAGLVMDLIAEHWQAQRPLPSMGTRFDETRAKLPFIRVNVVPSPADRLEMVPLVDISIFAAKYSDAADVALEVDHLLMGYPLSATSGGRVVLVDTVETISFPVEIDAGEATSTRRFLGTYQLRIRRG